MKYMNSWGTCGEVKPMISMCSASQPSSRAITEAIRRAKHFLFNKALPPYPLPNDIMSRSSGKWQIYLSGLQGQNVSTCPGANGMPTLCRPGTKDPAKSHCDISQFNTSVCFVHMFHGRISHSSHNLQVNSHIGRIRQLNPGMGQLRPNWTHAIWNNIHSTAAHTAAEFVIQGFLC